MSDTIFCSISYSSGQDSTFSRIWQVHVTRVMTRRTRFFGGTLIKYAPKRANPKRKIKKLPAPERLIETAALRQGFIASITRPKVIGLESAGQPLLSIFISTDLSLTLTIVSHLQIQSLGHFFGQFRVKMRRAGALNECNK